MVGRGRAMMEALKRHCGGETPSHSPCITDFELLRDDVLKYHSLITSSLSVGALWHQLELTKLGDAYKMTLVACGEDEYSFMCLSINCPHYFYVYQCMFEVLHLTLPLNDFQCALLRRLNVVPSQLHPNSWAVVRAFKILCPFFNISSSVRVLMYFFPATLSVSWMVKYFVFFVAFVPV